MKEEKLKHGQYSIDTISEADEDSSSNAALKWKAKREKRGHS